MFFLIFVIIKKRFKNLKLNSTFLERTEINVIIRMLQTNKTYKQIYLPEIYFFLDSLLHLEPKFTFTFFTDFNVICVTKSDSIHL